MISGLDKQEPLLKQEVNIQMGRCEFKLTKKDLVTIMDKYELRKKAEEIDYLTQLGGLEAIESGLITDFKNGIKNNQSELDIRENRFGNNKRVEREVRSFWGLLWLALDDFTLKILIVAAFVSMILQTAVAEPKDRSHAWIEGFAILMAVAVCSVVTAVNDYQREQQFQQLNKVADSNKLYTVFREGESIELHHSALMVGDLIMMREGMDIPVDGVLIRSCQVFTDESAMTGETEPVRKDDYSYCLSRLEEHQASKMRIDEMGQHDLPSCVLMGGTKVLQGEGAFVVIVIGDASCEGKIRAKLEDEEQTSTPLQQKLEAIANDIGNFGFYSAIIIVTALLIRFTIEKVMAGEFQSKDLVEILDFFIIGVTVVVVAIPEGLPLSVTLSLAFSVKRMLKDKNLVRKIQSCETMGGANMICSDKTGTLTQNKMSLQCIWNQQTYPISNGQSSYDLSSLIPSKEMHDIFTQMTVYNQSAQLRPVQKGSMTDIAVLEFLEKANIDIEAYSNKYNVLQKMPFNSRRKRMGVILDIGDNNKRLIVKGASELIVENCSHFQTFSGERIVIDNTLRQQIQDSIEELANNALRTIAYGYKDIGDEETQSYDSRGVFEVEKSGLTCVGVFGIRDTLRPEVPGAILQCKQAGIKVRMVTGDNKLTARAIALECGIIDKHDSQALVMEGPAFMERVGGIVCKKCREAECPCGKDKKTKRIDTIGNGNEFDQIIPHLCVLARSRPEDKYALVTGLMERGHVVAVTGDGTNDAPALKKADVGFAMGIGGTEVARQAAEIILMDDNFSSIVKAVMWGRNIYDNIKKFLQFQLTVNLVAVLSTMVGAVLLKQEVMTPIQMLWINLIMDSLASLALATESPTQALLMRPPHSKNEYMVTRNMFKHIIGQSVYQMTVLMIICFCGDQFIPEVKDDLDIVINNKMAAGDLTYTHLHGMHMKYSDGGQTLVRSGRMKTMSDSSNLFPAFGKKYQGQDYLPIFELVGPSRHFTFLFNTFVWMTIFNFLNARVLNDKINIMADIFSNPLFSIIVAGIAVMQVLLITFGGIPFSCYYWAPFYGLHWSQWVYCIAFSFGGLIWSLFLKQIPDSLFGQSGFGNKSQDPIKRQSSILQIKRQHSRLSDVRNISLNR